MIVTGAVAWVDNPADCGAVTLSVSLPVTGLAELSDTVLPLMWI